MTRLAFLVLCALLLGLQAAADDPPKKLTADEGKELEAKWSELITTGLGASRAGKNAEATKAFEEALAVARRLHPKADYPDGHISIAISLYHLARQREVQGEPGEAVPLLKESLVIARGLTKRDSQNVADIQHVLASLYQDLGKLTEAEPLYRDALAMNQRLHKGDYGDTAVILNNLALLCEQQGRLAEAEPLYKDALAMGQRLYKGDHPGVATTLRALGGVYHARGQLAEAEPLLRDALAMNRRLYKGDHEAVVQSLAAVAFLYQQQGKLAKAEPLYKDALAMSRRLHPGDHPVLAASMNNLAFLYEGQGKLAEAEPLYTEALGMFRRLHPGNHPEVATSLINLAALHRSRGQPAEAEPLVRDALAMRRRLFLSDHPELAQTLNNLALVCHEQGKFDEAERLFKDAVAMHRRLHFGDHPFLAINLSNLADLHRDQGKPDDAERLYADALTMTKRLVVTYAWQKTEGEALAYAANQMHARDGYLAATRMRAAWPAAGFDPASVYPVVWATKGMIGRVYEQRQQAARKAAADPRVTRMLVELADARRRRAELIFAPEVPDAVTRRKREQDIKDFDKRITELDTAIRPLLPALGRAEKLAVAVPADLQKVLPGDSVVVDFIRYTFFEHTNVKPGKDGVKQTSCYLAMVVTREKIAWVDLGPAALIEAAVATWRGAITSGKEIPAAVPTKVRELVWDKVRKELPAGIKTVYISPDMALCRVPWAALPGDTPGTILLEDFAVATIPHAPFLLDQLWPPEERKNPPTGALVVGGVDFQAEPTAAGQPVNRDLPLRADARGWPALPGAAAEATGVAGAATRKKLAVTPLRGEKATAAAVLSELPKARYAHFATHGFFADPSFRSVFQLDEKDYEKARWGERVGRAANSPLVMTGLVFAGANNPKTPGRGIVTGESLIDLDLSGLELAVLSACETGLGDVAGGEGTFGLQRAFHLAGAKNVVASLWKVRDDATAALMAEFYRNLWEKDLTPVEALRQAQLTIYRNPAKIGELAAGFRGKFEVVPGAKDEAVEPTAGGKAHPHLWAAFTLSGPGR